MLIIVEIISFFLLFVEIKFVKFFEIGVGCHYSAAFSSSSVLIQPSFSATGCFG